MKNSNEEQAHTHNLKQTKDPSQISVDTSKENASTRFSSFKRSNTIQTNVNKESPTKPFYQTKNSAIIASQSTTTLTNLKNIAELEKNKEKEIQKNQRYIKPNISASRF